MFPRHIRRNEYAARIFCSMIEREPADGLSRARLTTLTANARQIADMLLVELDNEPEDDASFEEREAELEANG